MLIRQLASIAALLTSICIVAQAAEETSLTIEVTKGREQAYALAMVSPDIDPGVTFNEDLFDIVRNNVSISGQLKVFPTGSMPSQPRKISDIDYSQWQQSGAEFILLSKVRADANNGYQLEYSLHDVFGERTLRSETLFFNQRSIRDTAHFLTDLVYEEITGLKGIFSTKIAYITLQGRRSQGPTYRLQISDIDGNRPQVVLVSKQPIISPTWAPSGREIAYVSFERGTSNIFAQNLITGKRRLISSFKGMNSAPDWSPDGSKIALVLSRLENTDIYVLDLNTGRTTRVTNDPRIDTEPSWSADGQRLIFTSERTGNPHIFEADLQNKRITQLTRKGKYNSRPRYVENGRAFVYIHLNDNKEYKLVKQSFVNDTPVELSLYSSDESPSVAPNGNAIVYSTQVNGKSTLVVVSSDGQVEYQLPSTSNEVIEPAWSNFRI